MMKTGTVVLAMAALIQLTGSSSAQCGCSSGYSPYMSGYPSMSYGSASHYAPPAPHYAPPVSHPITRPIGGGPASIAYVNRLANPIPRAKYTLNYAIHLTDGRILLSDFLPKGYTAQGIETQTGDGARRLRATMGGTGNITVRDPSSDQTVADFGTGGYQR